jgi:hypothetical protein
MVRLTDDIAACVMCHCVAAGDVSCETMLSCHNVLCPIHFFFHQSYSFQGDDDDDYDNNNKEHFLIFIFINQH